MNRPDSLAGTTLRVRLKCSESETELPEAPLRIRVFGRYSETSPWSPMRNALGACSVEIKMNLDEDVYNDAGFRYTTPDNHAHSWDCDGYRSFLILVEVALDTGGAEDAELEAKIV